ncbi:MAG: hypothetical protein QW279_08925 [Candidatus Jordarchaeaceae archaeon]
MPIKNKKQTKKVDQQANQSNLVEKTVVVKSIFKTKTSSGKDVWTFVSNNPGETYWCYDKRILEELGLSPDTKSQNLNNVEITVKLSGRYIRGVAPGQKVSATVPATTNRTFQQDRSISRGNQNVIEKVDRLSILRTTVMLMEFLDITPERFPKLLKEFEEYVLTGKCPESLGGER